MSPARPGGHPPNKRMASLLGAYWRQRLAITLRVLSKLAEEEILDPTRSINDTLDILKKESQP